MRKLPFPLTDSVVTVDEVAASGTGALRDGRLLCKHAARRYNSSQNLLLVDQRCKYKLRHASLPMELLGTANMMHYFCASTRTACLLQAVGASAECTLRGSAAAALRCPMAPCPGDARSAERGLHAGAPGHPCAAPERQSCIQVCVSFSASLHIAVWNGCCGVDMHHRQPP